jgi:hypothetical protein
MYRINGAAKRVALLIPVLGILWVSALPAVLADGGVTAAQVTSGQHWDPGTADHVSSRIT